MFNWQHIETAPKPTAEGYTALVWHKPLHHPARATIARRVSHGRWKSQPGLWDVYPTH